MTSNDLRRANSARADQQRVREPAKTHKQTTTIIISSSIIGSTCPSPARARQHCCYRITSKRRPKGSHLLPHLSIQRVSQQHTTPTSSQPPLVPEASSKLAVGQRRARSRLLPHERANLPAGNHQQQVLPTKRVDRTQRAASRTQAAMERAPTTSSWTPTESIPLQGLNFRLWPQLHTMRIRVASPTLARVTPTSNINISSHLAPRAATSLREATSSSLASSSRRCRGDLARRWLTRCCIRLERGWPTATRR